MHHLLPIYSMILGLYTRNALLLRLLQVPEHTEFMWILSCTASVGYLSRMTQWKVGIHMGRLDSVVV